MKLTEHGWGVTPLSIDPAKAEAAFDATRNAIDEVTRLRQELATLKADRERLAQSVAEAVREACASNIETTFEAADDLKRDDLDPVDIVRATPTDDIVARVLGGGR